LLLATLLCQVYEEVVLPDGTTTSEFIDVAEVEVGDGRSASPVKIGALTGVKSRRKSKPPATIAVTATSVSPVSGGRPEKLSTCFFLSEAQPKNAVFTPPHPQRIVMTS
jgi:hypothetical protein